MANLITGDAVTLDLRVAGLPSRVLALAVDLAIQAGVLVLGIVLTSWVFGGGGSEGAEAALTLTVVVLALVGWPTLVETLSRGRSAGKAMMGLRVVRDDGGPIRMRHALVRALAMVFLDLWTTSGVVGGLSALLSSRSKRMGDHLAGTIVVGERIPRSAAPHDPQIVMPPPLAGWAAGLELVAVPDALALNARTFLHRAPSLDPSARYSLGTRLATEMSRYVRTPAPLGTPAEAYLAAVLAERTRRAVDSGREEAGIDSTPGGGAPGGRPYPRPPADRPPYAQPPYAQPPYAQPPYAQPPSSPPPQRPRPPEGQ